MAFTCTGKLNVKQLIIMQPNESYIAKQNHVTASILDRDQTVSTQYWTEIYQWEQHLYLVSRSSSLSDACLIEHKCD